MKTNKRTHKISPPLTSTAQSPFTNGCWPIRTRPPAVSTPNDTAAATSSHTENANNTPPHEDDHHGNTFLKPGNILLKCSGSDIQLSKTAHVPPNFVTGRGRFLFLLPGLLSLQRPPPSPPNEDQPNGNGNRTDDNVQGGGSQRDALVPFSHSSSGMYTLGNIQKLDTEEPILELSLGDGEKNGHGGKRLVFQGKKVKTCGRYLVLSCKTSGAVHCRNVFEELVVFGGEHEVVEESGEQVVDVNNKTEEKEQSQQEEEEEQNQLDDDSVGIVEEEEEKDSANLSKNVDTKEPLFYHYGGSERAVDGGRPVRGIKRKKSLSTVVSMDIGSKRVNATSSSTTRNGKTIRKSDVSQQEDATNVIDLESEEEEEDNDDFEMNTPVPTTTRTRYVRKSATKRVKYTFDEEEEQDQGQNSEESEEEECSVAFDSPQQSRKKPPKVDSTCTSKPAQKEKKEQHGDVTVKKDQTTRGTTKKQSDVTRTKRNIILSKNTKAETELNALSTSSPAFRKRRKSPKKTSSASKSLDGIMMNDDEDFIFVE